MQAELVKTFRFEAAHSLSGVPQGHKCRRLHGHSYRIDVHVAGKVDPQTGMVMDFGDIKRVVGAVLDELDHRNLDDIPGLENSTSENLAAWIWRRVAADIPDLSAVAVWESPTSHCIYRGG